MNVLERLSINIKNSHEETKSWQKTGELYGLNKAMARLLAQGYDPGNKIRKQLGLPPSSTVIVMNGEQIPDGAQVLGAVCCKCGEWFVSNTPQRKRCYVCSPMPRTDGRQPRRRWVRCAGHAGGEWITENNKEERWTTTN